MTVLSIEEFDAQCSVKINSLKKIHQGKTLIGGAVFPSTDIQAAKSYCEIFSQKQTEKICLIVKDKSFIRIWTEASTMEEAQTCNNLQPLNSQEVSSRSLQVEAKFVSDCEKLLAEYIGPISQMVCKKVLAKKPNLTRAEFVDLVAKKISDPQQAQDFKQQFFK